MIRRHDVGNTTSASTFGAGIAIPFGNHVQIVGEAGRLSDVTSSLLDAALDLTPLNVQMSAWYAEGGLRLMGSRHSVVRPLQPPAVAPVVENGPCNWPDSRLAATLVVRPHRARRRHERFPGLQPDRQQTSVPHLLGRAHRPTPFSPWRWGGGCSSHVLTCLAPPTWDPFRPTGKFSRLTFCFDATEMVLDNNGCQLTERR